MAQGVAVHRALKKGARVVFAVTSGVACVLSSGRALAGGPSVAECLAASDASSSAHSQHKLRAEREAVLVCSAPACPTDIRKECLRRMDEVTVQMPTIVFLAKDVGGADLTAVKVTMDQDVLTDRLDGTAIPVDPGQHAFSFEALGREPVTRTLLVVEGQKVRTETVTFEPPKAAPAPIAAALPGAAPPPGAASHASEEPKAAGGLGAQRTLGLVAGGLGVVGLGIGTVAGALALSKRSDAESQCPGACATKAGVDAWSSAHSMGNVSTVALIAGGVALAGGAVLWFTAPARASSARVGVAADGVRFAGEW